MAGWSGPVDRQMSLAVAARLRMFQSKLVQDWLILFILLNSVQLGLRFVRRRHLPRRWLIGTRLQVLLWSLFSIYQNVSNYVMFDGMVWVFLDLRSL